jgi:hypothetical protein
MVCIRLDRDIENFLRRKIEVLEGTIWRVEVLYRRSMHHLRPNICFGEYVEIVYRLVLG